MWKEQFIYTSKIFLVFFISYYWVRQPKQAVLYLKVWSVKKKKKKNLRAQPWTLKHINFELTDWSTGWCVKMSKASKHSKQTNKNQADNCESRMGPVSRIQDTGQWHPWVTNKFKIKSQICPLRSFVNIHPWIY